MNSIYDEDLAINNDKGTNTMKNSKNTEQVDRTAQDDEQEDRASLQAAVEAVSMERDDWQKSALEMTEERDALRALLAARDTQIDQLRDTVRELEGSVVYLARTASYTKGLADAQGRILEQEGARKREQRKCEAERQANENAIGDIINDLENGNY
jgi:hypothetical protein